MSAGPIGEAHVLISPELRGFAERLKAELKAAMAAAGDPQIKVAPDTTGFKEKVKKETDKTEKTTKAKVPVAPDLSRFSAEVRAYLAKFDPKEQVKIAAALDRASLAKSVAAAKKLLDDGLKPDRNRFQRALKAAITPHPELFQALRAPLARGLSTPLGLAITTALTAILLPAIASAITAGLGLGLVALGAFALRGSKILKSHFKAAGGVISESLRQAALPLRGPFLQAIKAVGLAMFRLQPQFRGLFEGLAPAIKPFVDGLTGFVQQLLPGIQAAMPGINAAFAEFGARLPGLGKTLGGMFAAIAENLPAIQRGVGILFTLTEGLINITGALLTLGQAFSGIIATALHPVGTAIGWVKEHVLGLDSAQKAATVTRDGLTEAEYAGVLAERLAAYQKEQNAKKADELTTKLKQLKAAYQQEVDSIRQTIEGYKGLVTQSGVTASRVVQDLANQVTNFRTYSRDVKRLIKEGVSPAAIQELSQKGPQYVHALATGSNRELERYKRLWKERQAEVKGNFAESLRLQLTDLAKKIKAMQKEIDKLKGKTVDITAEAQVNAPKGTLLLIEKGLHARGIRKAARGWRVNEGSGPTSDDVLARVSRGETIVPASASARPEFMAWARTQRIPGFASGGQPAGDLDRFRAGMTRTDNSFREVALALGRGVLDALKSGLSSFLPSLAAAGKHAAGSWKAATNFLSQVGIPYNIISTFRPGARTRASGSQSYHALNRAVDLTGPNMLAIWKALVGTNPTELIYSRAPRYKSRSGWKPIGRLDPITRADHYDHVHAAYDKGGLLMPGVTMAENRTGRPELVTPAGRDALGRVRFGGTGVTVQNLIVQPLSGQFRLRDVMTELQLQGVH